MKTPLKTKIFNLSQVGRQFVGMKPRLCHYPQKKWLCDGCEPSETFLCSKCARLMPWCMGAADDYFDICDQCFAKINEENKLNESAN